MCLTSIHHHLPTPLSNLRFLHSSYFDEKGLVRQQLDSFDEFIQMSVQRIVEDTPPIEMQAETQYDDTEAPVSGVRHCESDMYIYTYYIHGMLCVLL